MNVCKFFDNSVVALVAGAVVTSHNIHPAMFARTVLCRARALSAFGAFLKQTKGKFPNFGAKRAQIITAKFNALSAEKRAELKAIGLKSRFTAPRKVKSNRKLTKYNKFVKANIGKFANLSTRKRMTAVAKLWQKSA